MTNHRSRFINEKKIFDVLRYFHYFKYAPSLDEIHKFLSYQTTKKALLTDLNYLIIKSKLTSHNVGHLKLKTKDLQLYTLPGHGIDIRIQLDRTKYTSQVVEKNRLFLEIISKVPVVKLIGLSGSTAMGQMKKNDDLDLFIITANNRLWTARLVVTLLAILFGLKRRPGAKKAPGKACMNLFFEISSMEVPEYKQNLYTAHEVLQMVPLYIHGGAYSKSSTIIHESSTSTYISFLETNKWVYKYFPNAMRMKSKSIYLSQKQTPGKLKNIADWIEKIVKTIQLYLISRHRTREMITDGQLWFFPKDFEEKLKRDKILE